MAQGMGIRPRAPERPDAPAPARGPSLMAAPSRMRADAGPSRPGRPGDASSGTRRRRTAQALRPLATWASASATAGRGAFGTENGAARRDAHLRAGVHVDGASCAACGGGRRRRSGAHSARRRGASSALIARSEPSTSAGGRARVREHGGTACGGVDGGGGCPVGGSGTRLGRSGARRRGETRAPGARPVTHAAWWWRVLPRDWGRARVCDAAAHLARQRVHLEHLLEDSDLTPGEVLP